MNPVEALREIGFLLERSQWTLDGRDPFAGLMPQAFPDSAPAVAATVSR